MCGIFGGIGNWHPAAIRALAIANRERGTDSLGFFNSTGRMFKGAGDPLDVLAEGATAKFVDNKKPWFIAGHTRLATRGKPTRRNAHPFRRGRIVGCHNGTVAAPRRYQVDSEYLIDLLHTHDYAHVCATVTGYWSLAWFDGADLFLACERNTVAVGQTVDATYWSSERSHLLAAVPGIDKCFTLRCGEMLRIDCSLAAHNDYELMSVARPAYVETLVKQCGFTDVDDAMKYYGTLDLDALETELAMDAPYYLWDDETVRPIGCNPEKFDL